MGWELFRHLTEDTFTRCMLEITKKVITAYFTSEVDWEYSRFIGNYEKWIDDEILALIKCCT